MLDGAAKIDALCAEAARLGQPAVAMTDHGNMHGAYAFYQAARRHGVKPIIGVEAYCAPASRTLREPVYWGTAAQVDAGIDVGGKGAHTHLTLLAENAAGLRNLFRLTSRASLTGFYRKPRVDRELLAEYADGVIATTGCLGGEVPIRLRLGQHAEAREAAGAMRDIFGDRYCLEVMDHGITVERELRSDLLALGAELGLTPLATNDSHYVTADQAGAHDALLCVQTRAKISDVDRFRFEGTGYHLRSATEMRGYWDAELPGACDATLAVAERVGDYSEVFAPADRMPRFPLPDGHTADSWLAEEVSRGLAVRYPDGVPPGHAERVAYELGVISAMGFPGYFLVVADLCEHARRLRIRTGPGRGSAAGSLVAYALSITGLDPIVHNLMFERFLNPDRIAPPDIDLDFDERRRGELIAYLTERWGADRVAQVVTFGTIRAKAAVRDAARVLGAPYMLGDRMSKLLPAAVSGFDAPLAAVTDPAHERYAEAGELRALIGADPQASAVLDTARGLEGLTRQVSVHASGVILSRDPLVETLPLWAREDDTVITAWDFPTCDEMGLLKVDLLGLRNLTIIEDTVTAVAARRGVHVDPAALSLDDPETFALFGRGDTLGVFQFDSPAIRALLRRIGPTGFADISAAQALYRPGPMGTNTHNEYADRKNRRRPVRPIHPELGEALTPVLGDTYHLLVYQEQVVAAAVALAGYTAAQGDLLRKAMG
ncbi:MAG: DNA polymerase III subunit alpha, partial [Pseudonocardiaceae bacterium]